jgi:hypothetical protein
MCAASSAQTTCVSAATTRHADDPTATLAPVERKVAAVAWQAEEVHVPCRPSAIGTPSHRETLFAFAWRVFGCIAGGGRVDRHFSVVNLLRYKLFSALPHCRIAAPVSKTPGKVRGWHFWC